MMSHSSVWSLCITAGSREYRAAPALCQHTDAQMHTQKHTCSRRWTNERGAQMNHWMCKWMCVCVCVFRLMNCTSLSTRKHIHVHTYLHVHSHALLFQTPPHPQQQIILLSNPDPEMCSTVTFLRSCSLLLEQSRALHVPD